MKVKHPRAAAIAVAKELCDALRPLCVVDRLIVAGSLRRRKAEVSDVEICYLGRVESRPDPQDLLGQLVPTNLADAWINQAVREGRLAYRPNVNGSRIWGASNKLAVHVASGIPVDFFQPGKAAGWWSLLVCRTGSKEHNETVCNAAIARGEKWNPYLGFEDRKDGRLLFTPASERALFDHVKLPWLEPWQR